MQSNRPLGQFVRAYARTIARGMLLGAWLAASPAAFGQAPGGPAIAPAPGSSCTVSALNRNAPVAADASFEIYNIPGNSGAFRARATCSDGTVGQTAVVFPAIGEQVVFTGDIAWGRLDPAPLALGLRAASGRLGRGATAQLAATAVALDASVRDVTPRAAGTSYAVSNALLADISQDGLVRVLPLFASGSSARVVASATNEGGVAASYMFVLGPRGSLSGRVLRADGLTPVASAQVTVMRDQPMEQAGTALTDAAGNFQLADVSAGVFRLSVIDPASGDRGQASARIDNEGEVARADIRLNGQGQVVVTVLDAAGKPVPNAPVTLTALGAVSGTRTRAADSGGRAVFDGVAAGDITVSTRDPGSMLVGTALGLLQVGGVLPISLKLQPVGAIEGAVRGADGGALQEGVQVRILSRERGIVSQAVTGADGRFSFSPLPLSDGPFTLDAFVDGRLRARVPNLVLSAPNQILAQDLRFEALGLVRGVVTDADGKPFSSVTLTLQSLSGQRLSFSASAGADGAYMVQGVPVGGFTLGAATGDGRTGAASGTVVADGATVIQNIQLASSGLVGTVFERDGVTPAGAGVEVYLQRRPQDAQLALNLTQASPAVVARSITDAKGQYAFSIATPDVYVVQAQAGENRGRTQVVITAIVPGKPNTANLAFLGKGLVTGVVRASNGATRAGLPVTVSSVGAFTNSWTGTTDAGGRFAVANVFVGDIVVSVQDAQAKQGGIASGRMIGDGNTVALDVTLTASGTVRGRILKADGLAAASAPLLVQAYAGAGGPLLASQLVGSGNTYELPLLPLGEVRIVARETASGDQGLVTTRLSSADEVKTTDVRMIGQGAVRVTLRDGAGQPVAGGAVSLHSSSAFPSDRSVLSDAGGLALIQPVFNGDFTVSASKQAQIGQVSGSAQGTVVNGATADVAITLSSRPTGSIRGVVYAPDGVTPKPRVALALTPAPAGSSAYRTVTGADGSYVLENIEGDTAYTLTARLADLGAGDRIRAQAMNLRIGAQDEAVTRNLTLLGAGSVGGKVTLADGTPAPGITVVFNNADPVFGRNPAGGAYSTSTGSDGGYSLADMPAGDFTLRAANSKQSLRAEGSGRIRFDQDAAKVDLTLVDDSVAMPVTLHDANAMPFDIDGRGAVRSGKNSVFTGSGPDSGGMRLDLVMAGVAVPFTNGDGSIGRLSGNKQQVEVDEVHASGLNVARRVYVPKNGYFARYLEVLENRTDAPISVDVRVTTHHSQSDGNPRVVDSSDGDNVLSVADPVQRDRWVAVDDGRDMDPFQGSSAPATGHLFDGAGAPLQVSGASYGLVGQTGKLVFEWRSLTLQPGQRTALMHFAFNQLDRFRARAAAVRLAQLPPEALAGLTPEERAAIVNFVLPPDGVGTLPALPVLDNGRVQGTVLAGDGTTPVAAAKVRFKSKNVLFGRDVEVSSDAQGRFNLAALVDGSAAARALPLDAFDLEAIHPHTAAHSAAAIGNFAGGTNEALQDLSFIGTATVRGTLRGAGGVVADGELSVALGGGSRYAVRSGADGSFLFTGLPPGDYTLKADKAHPQAPGSCCGIEGSAPVAAVAGTTTVADVTLENTGSIGGIVRSAKGTPVVGAQLRLFDSLNRYARTTVTDTAGRYRFVDVRLGAARIEAYDAVSKAGADASVAVGAGVETPLDLVLKGFGTINVQVNYARGAAAPAASVSHDLNTWRATDTAGQSSYSLQVGTYQFRARHPDNPSDASLWGSATVMLANDGDSASVTLTLKSAGTISGSIVRPDGSTLAGGFPYSVRLVNGASNAAREGRTDGAGNFRIGGLALGTYLVTAYDPSNNRFADTEATLLADGGEAAVALRLEENRIALPADLYDANRFRHDVRRDGALAAGSSAFRVAAALTVNGQPFAGDTSAVLELGKRQFAIAQPDAIGALTVTRKVFVPKGGYFARYLEVFENRGATPATLSADLATGYAAAQLVASSSQGTQPRSADHWVVLDDAADGDIMMGAAQPPTAHVHGNAGAAAVPSEVQLGGAGANAALLQRWNGLAVPAGGKLALMHFVVQQVNRAGALAAAERLVQLPPEALEGLTADERAAIVNFALPEGGVSSLPSLPALTGRISGRALEGDGVTAVNGVRVTFRSAHPLFNRLWGMQSDGYLCPGGTPLSALLTANTVNQDPNLVVRGAYALQGVVNDSASIAIPVGVDVTVRAQEALGCFGDHAGHPLTGMASTVATLPVQGALTQDVQFGSGILTGTVSGGAGIGVTSGSVWRSIDDPSQPGAITVPIAADGTYVFPGLAPGSYDLLAGVPHPQGGMLRGERLLAQVTLGSTTVTDIALQSTGALAGAVLTANGESSVNAKVELIGAAEGQQYDACAGCGTRHAYNIGRREVKLNATTDTLGRYSFSAVPSGSYVVTVTDPVSGGKKSDSLAVGQGENVVRNITLLSLGSVRLSLLKAGGAPAPDANVYLLADAEGRERLVGRTDSAGQLTVANVPRGAYRLRVVDPRAPGNPLFERALAGAISTNGEIQQQGARLFAMGSLRVLPQDGDNGNTQLGGVGMTVNMVNTGLIGEEGGKLLPGLREGDEIAIGLTRTLEGSPASLLATASIGVADDDKVRDLPLAIKRTVGSIEVLVLDKENGNQPVSGAQVLLGAGTAVPALIGVTDSAGRLFRAGVAPGAYRVIARATVGGELREASLTGAVTAANIGATQLVTAPIQRAVLKQNVLGFEGERHLYSVPVAPGNIVAVTLKGAQVGAVAPVYQVRTYVHDTQGYTAASGYAYSPQSDGNYVQVNSQGNLKNVVVNQAGHYTVAVTTYSSDPRNLGAYELGVSVNGAAVVPLPYQGGGAVRGTVLRADRVTPEQGARVRLQTFDNLGLMLETVTDEKGAFRFENVPLTVYEVRAIVGGTMVAKAQGQIDAAGSTTVTDIVKPPVTVFEVQVVNPDGTPYVGASVGWTNNTDTSGTLNLDQNGRATLTYKGEAAVRFSAYKITNSLVTTSLTAAAADGRTVPVVLTLASASVAGKVVSATGAAVAYAEVRVNRAADGPWRWITSRYADATGVFSFADLPIGEELVVSARDPYATAKTPGSARFTLQGGQAITGLVLAMPGLTRANGQVLLSTGKPLAAAWVSIQWPNWFDQYAGQKEAYTDQDGRFTLDNVPAGIPVTVSAQFSGHIDEGGWSESIRGSMTATLVAGTQADLPPLVLQVGAVVKAMLRTPDGASPGYGSCAFATRAGALEGVRNSSCEEPLLLAGLPAGPVSVSIGPRNRAPYGVVQVDAVTDQEAEAVVWMSKLSGAVRYRNGAVAEYPTVYLIDAAGDMLQPEYSEAGGSYVIRGARPGPFTITAQDSNGLSTMVNGTVADPKTAIALDITLPPSGTVTGVVTNAANLPVANAMVYLRAASQEFERTASTNAEGRYTIPMVAADSFVVSASDQASGSAASASGALNGDGTIVTVDLRLPATGSVSGQVVGSNGATAAASSYVSLRFLEADGAFGNFGYNAYSNASGNYSFPAVAPGLVKLYAFDSNWTSAGAATGSVAPAAASTVKVRLGSAVMLPSSLLGADEGQYELDLEGRVAATPPQGWGQAYSGYYGLDVNGLPFLAGEVATVVEAGRELLSGPRMHRGLSVTRRFYVPAGGGYLRIVDSFSNPGSTTINAKVRLLGRSQTSEGPRVTKRLGGGSGYVVYSAPAYNNDYLEGAVATVYQGASGGLAPASIQFFNGDSSFDIGWNLSVPPGQTASLMTFTRATSRDQADSAAPKAAALANGSDPDMLHGLSAQDKAAIKNFNLSP